MPLLYISDNVSLGIIGMKVETAYTIIKKAKDYNIIIPYRENMAEALTNDQDYQALLLVAFVEIMYNEWHEYSNENNRALLFSTLYNVNTFNKKPRADWEA
jgi:hypothetical protein